MIKTSPPGSIERSSKYLDLAFPIFFFLMAVAFYLRTYDSAQVKITILQMCGTILVALWFFKVFESGRWPFNKNQTMIVLPIIAMFISGVFSFIHSPLLWGSFNDFVRRVVYVGIAMIAVTEMTSREDFRRLTQWLIWAVAAATLYGLIQWIDFNYFPPGPPSVGLDKFVWRRAFGVRVFSTFGNPNFYSNFLVIMIPVMVAFYLKTKKFYLLPLIALTLINIYWTGSKGPFMGVLAGTTVFGLFFTRFFVQSKQVRNAVFIGCGAVVLGLGSLIYYKVFIAHGGLTSFSFRVYTWLSTWEMVNAHPVIGNGIGNFWVIYPAYRRPAIFHIEGKHNTETDHAENEHLEVWMDEGIIGMGLWIWLIFNLVLGIYKSLKFLTSQPTRAGPITDFTKFPEEAFCMLGFTSGMLGMLIHNNTDVSMRFVSSGTPFWLLVGLNTALIMHSPLPDTQTHHPVGDPLPTAPTPGRVMALKIFKGIAVLTTVIVAIRILREFDWCQMRDGMLNENERPHFIVTWAVFLLVWGSATYWFLVLALKSTRIKSAVTLIRAAPLLGWFWGFFLGDINHNRAIFFSKQAIWSKTPEFDTRLQQFPPEYQNMYRGNGEGFLAERSAFGKTVKFIFPDVFWRKNGIGGALDHYYEVHRLSPYFIMDHYFRGNVYNDWGADYANKALDAFGRGDVAQGEIYRKLTEERWNNAMDAYVDTRKLGPNYVQMHHQVGTVHQKWGDFLVNLAPQAERFGRADLAAQYRAEAFKHWEEALSRYKLYRMIDPVFDQNYYRMAQLFINMGRLNDAEDAYIANMLGEQCRAPEQQIPYTNGFEDENLVSENDRYDLASPRHAHDRVINGKPEAWMILGDFYLQIVKNLAKAEEAYLKAVACTPDETFKVGGHPSGPNVYRAWPEHVTFLKRLANVYAMQGKSQLAVQTWQRIQYLKPDDPDLQRMISQSQGKK